MIVAVLGWSCRNVLPVFRLDGDGREHLGVKDDPVLFVLDLLDLRAVFVIAAVLIVPLVSGGA